jgi:hypothetical protein
VDRTSNGRMLAVLACALGASVHADTFASVHYDAHSDELIATMIYRGTNPNHAFTLQWDPCPDKTDSRSFYEIGADVLDAQWNDAALRPFRKVAHFSLTTLLCRPAEVTLRSAPRFRYTIVVPPAPPRTGK